MLETNLFKIRINIIERINIFNDLTINSLSLYFNNKEIENIYTLIDENFLKIDTNETKIIKLTKKGKKILFCDKNANIIINFCNKLDESGYNYDFDFIMEFIDNQNLELNPEEIFTIENFRNYIIEKYNNNEANTKKIDFNYQNDIFKTLKLRYRALNVKNT